MTYAHPADALEQQIAEWRGYLQRRQALRSLNVAELENRLREQIQILTGAGLTPDEAFLVAVKRVGDLDVLSREFARENSDHLWKQLVLVPSDAGQSQGRAWTDGIVAFGLAVAAAVLIKLPALFGFPLEKHPGFYARNASLFVLPLLAGYFVWKRQLAPRAVGWLAAAFVVGGCFANVYPFLPHGHTEVLTVLHLPMALWLAVGVAYAGQNWGSVAGRMHFIRFSGELFIYYVLIALGGGVLMGFTGMLFSAIGLRADWFYQNWILPCGAVGAVVVGSWLVEAKQNVIENMAPVLTRLFTPLFTAALLAFLGTLVWTQRGVDIERNALIGFDLLLVVVLGLLLYSISARDPRKRPGAFDVLQVVLVISALAADAIMLWAIAARISEFGFSANRVAALGENVLLLVNLAGSAVLYVRFLGGRGSFAALEKWQTDYLPVYAAWAAFVVVAFPPLFQFK